ncbi:MAG: hypothetical protein Q7J84_12775 [Sulfuricaulis sp.]|nr:hypothetical protein [Sulfuricaulis sp.]
MKKKIIIIGWILLGVLFIGLLTLTLVAIMQGEGARPWKLVRGGKGGHVFPIELLTIFLVLIVVGVFWVKNRFFSSNKKNQKHYTNDSEI